MNTPSSDWSRADLNQNFDSRASWNADSQQWQSTRAKGVVVQPIEVVNDLSVPRFTALLRLSKNTEYPFRHHASGAELLVLEGSLDAAEHADASGELCGSGTYLRYPLNSGLHPKTTTGCTVFLKVGQTNDEDTVYREIDTGLQAEWLPGPVEGTEVLPLHVQGGKSILMIRWNEPVFFKPKLDPQGEEIFVVSGKLHDATGTYGPGTWIRNPVPAWQAWGGGPGTVVYYKNGHFPHKPD